MNKTVLLVSHDKKTVSQLSRWLKELPDEVAVETATNLDEVKDKFLNRSETASDVAPITTVVRLLIFDVAMFGSTDPIDYISETRAAFQNSAFCSTETPVKVMILSFDNAALPLKTFIHEDIDDLLMKPLDHQLFLQKAGMMLADKSATAGNFLFKQKADFSVEMAKDVRIVKMSEFGVVISNPSPLAPGVYAHLYSNLFGEKKKSSVWGRVFSARRDPKVRGNYLCFFSFFGIQPDQLSTYRRALRERRKEIRFHETGYDKAKVPAAIRHVAVIDRNPASASLIADSLSANYLNLKTYTFSSYAQFLRAVSGSAVSTVDEQTLASTDAEPVKPFAGSILTLTISTEGADLQKVEPGVVPAAHFCGHLLEDLEGTNKWLDALAPSDKDEWDEFLLTLRRGHKSQAILHFKNVSGATHTLLVRGENSRSSEIEGKTIRLELRELSQEELELENDRRSKEKAVFSQVDAIYIDALSIPAFTPWYEHLKDLLKNSNLLIGEKLPVCLMVEEKSSIDLAEYRIPAVSDLVFKPIDRRFVASKAAIIISDLVASNEDNVDLSFTPADLPAKISKEVRLNEVAEFGFQIKSSIPLREGIFLRFYSPLFLDETGEGVLGRSTSCTQDPNEKDSFGCFFTFFGVTDAQLKHIRNWIREDYVNKKDSATG